jgi:vitamin B12/bleomycin/antimicrobial peptide transport system ATP-binding/permease protein
VTVAWSTEWLNSLVWIVVVTVLAVLGSAIALVLVARLTRWGRQFRRLAFPYFSPRGGQGWGPLLTLLAVIALAMAAVRVQVVNSYIVNGLYTALQDGDAAGFGHYIVIFAILSVVALAQALLAFYVQQRLVLRWRVWLNDRIVGDWLDDRAYHRARFTSNPVDNPDQRIQEDITTFTLASVTLGVGAVSSLVSLVSFTVILWQLSGPLPVFGIEIPRAMTFAAYLYIIVATVIAFRIGRPLIQLNFLKEALNASFRYALVRLRDSSESVAMYQGEDVERGILSRRFRAVIGNAWAIVFRTLKFEGFNIVITQYSQIIPLVLQAPRFFAGQISLGDIQQTAQAFGQVQTALSFFRLAYDQFASYRATLIRLNGLLDTDAEARELPSVELAEGEGLAVEGLTVRLPDDRTLIDDLTVDVATGDALLVTGASGSGKTTLLRSLADLWPFAVGTVRRPLGRDAFFLTQQPYVPLATMRAALTYPEAADGLADDRAAAVLDQVQLPHLADRLDDETDWSRRLSPGEQQRVSFARVLLARPKVVFLDEATSALDEGMEADLYTLLRTELPDAVIVSVGHRSTLARFHARQLELVGDGAWRYDSEISTPQR